MKHEQLCLAIIEQLGGKENILGVVHCATRLRFKLRDITLPNDETVKALSLIHI